jgi:hypothetical protein
VPVKAAIVMSVLLAASGCYDERATALCQPAIATGDFAAVSSMLGASCGSLDCHGQVGRALRLYGSRGVRLAPDDVSGHGGTRTAEHEANARALTGLEPELMCDVVHDGGEQPERLTLVRKAFGEEEHTGGEVLAPRGDGRACVLGWLAGRVDAERCQRAIDTERPE